MSEFKRIHLDIKLSGGGCLKDVTCYVCGELAIRKIHTHWCIFHIRSSMLIGIKRSTLKQAKEVVGILLHNFNWEFTYLSEIPVHKQQELRNSVLAIEAKHESY